MRRQGPAATSCRATADLGAISQSAAHDIRRRVLIEYREHQARAGTMPGEWQRWVEQALDPVVPWTQVLAASIRRGIGWAHGHVDYTYSKLFHVATSRHVACSFRRPAAPSSRSRHRPGHLQQR
jgi:hypothetical protein